VGPVHVGVRSKTRAHHDGDGPGIVGAAIYGAISWTGTQNAVTRTRRWMSLLPNARLKSWILAPSTPICSKSAFQNNHGNVLLCVGFPFLRVGYAAVAVGVGNDMLWCNGSYTSPVTQSR
jgi:hypothetical protein